MATQTPTTSEFIKSAWQGQMSFAALRRLHEDKSNLPKSAVGMFVVHGPWNVVPQDNDGILQMFDALLNKEERSDTKYLFGSISVQDSHDMDDCCGDNHTFDDNHNHQPLPCPPEHLPAVLLFMHRRSMKNPIYRYLSTIKSGDILFHWRNQHHHSTISNTHIKELHDALSSFGMVPSIPPSIDDSLENTIRIFVAGDRMSVGKTSVCLGILGSLVARGYPCESLAYIKPATQNESPQLVQLYCERMGISCIPIGPVVYYRGFTRAFLAGQTESSPELLKKVEVSVDQVARGKHVVIIDGVGFPAVGSICGTDNASVARSSGYPLLSSSESQQRIPCPTVLVGGSGVGSAVDSFNLNAAYFERAQVTVLGAIFNKLSLEGFYSLENCKEQITRYFDQNEHQVKLGRQAFGFVPLFPGLASEKKEERVDEYIRIFEQHVNLEAIILAAEKVRDEGLGIGTVPMDVSLEESRGGKVPQKRRKLEDGSSFVPRTREEIEGAAIQAGAAPSA